MAFRLPSGFRLLYLNLFPLSPSFLELCLTSITEGIISMFCSSPITRLRVFRRLPQTDIHAPHPCYRIRFFPLLFVFQGAIQHSSRWSPTLSVPPARTASLFYQRRLDLLPPPRTTHSEEFLLFLHAYQTLPPTMHVARSLVPSSVPVKQHYSPPLLESILVQQLGSLRCHVSFANRTANPLLAPRDVSVLLPYLVLSPDPFF